MKTVEVPGMGDVEFPDDATTAEINDFLQSHDTGAASSSPVPDTIGPGPTFGQRVGRAIDVFRQTYQPHGWGDVLSPVLEPSKLPKAIMAAGEQLFPNSEYHQKGLELLSPITGPLSESQKSAQRYSGAPENEGLVPGLVRSLGRIEPIANVAEGLKAEPLASTPGPFPTQLGLSLIPKDSLLESAGKAARNVALDVASATASPMGFVLAGSAALAPQATAAAMSPLVLKSIQEASRNFATDSTDQKKIEGILTSVLQVGGTLAGLKMGGPKIPPVIETVKPPVMGRTTKPSPDAAIAQEATAASKRLESSLGIRAPLSAAERTGAEGLAWKERFWLRVGAGDTTKPLPYQAQQQAVSDAVKNVVSEQAKEAGTKSEVGAQVAKELTEGEKALRGEVGQATGKGAQEIEAGVKSKISEVGQTMEATTLGDKTREAIVKAINAKKDEGQKLYQTAEQLLQQADGPKEFIEPTNVSKVAQDILDVAPTRLTPAGQREVMPLFLEAYNKIKDLSTWSDKQTAQQMQRAISTIGEAIGRLDGGASDSFGGGFKLGDLKDIYGALRQDFDQSIAKLSPKAQKAYQEARDFHRNTVEMVEQHPMISKVSNTGDKGGLTNTGEITDIFASGKGKLNDLEVFGKLLKPDEYGNLKAGVINSLRGQSSIPTVAGDIEDMTSFAEGFRKLAPEFKRELMGSTEKSDALQATLDKSLVGKEAVDVLGGRVPAPPDALKNLIDDIQAGRTAEGNRKFGEAIAKEGARLRDYHNEITKSTLEGTLGRSKVDPGKYVDDFLLKTKNVNVVRDSLRQLSVKTRDGVQKHLAQNLFEDAIDPNNSTVQQLIAGQGEISGEKLINLFIKDPEMAQVIQEVIPESSKELIADFVMYQRGIENARKLGGTTGMLASQARQSSRGGGLWGTIKGLPESFIKAKVLRKVSEKFFSEPIQDILADAVSKDKFLVQSAAIWGMAKMGANKMFPKLPGIPPEAWNALSTQLGASQIQDYLETKRRIDERLSRATPEEQNAAMILMPEIATPIALNEPAQAQTDPAPAESVTP